MVSNFMDKMANLTQGSYSCLVQSHSVNSGMALNYF